MRRLSNDVAAAQKTFLSYLERLYIDAGMCANCCISEATDELHVDCAGPEGYSCDCQCEGLETT